MKMTMIKAFLLMLAIPAAFVLLTSMKVVTPVPNATNGDIKITDLDLNRKAVQLTGTKKEEFPLADKGFLWDSDDSKTKKWRPQGITGMTDKASKKEFVIVSWYGRSEGSYSNRGARISVIDITRLATAPADNNYRHILLLDKDKKTFANSQLSGDKGTMHAGGIVAIDGKLHVADSRRGNPKGEDRVIRVFDLNKTQKITTKIHNYEYVLIEEYNYKAPIKPSFISYDKDKKQILIGTFAEKPSSCKPNFIAWFTPPTAATAAQFNKNILSDVAVYRIPDKYKKLQGMVSSKDASGKQILWFSTSFGRGNRSNFYKMNIDINANTEKCEINTIDGIKTPIVNTTQSSSTKYPPGLEDAYLSASDHLWLLTEFAYKEGMYADLDKPTGNTSKNKSTRRGVFCIKKADILP